MYAVFDRFTNALSENLLYEELLIRIIEEELENGTIGTLTETITIHLAKINGVWLVVNFNSTEELANIATSNLIRFLDDYHARLSYGLDFDL